MLQPLFMLNYFSRTILFLFHAKKPPDNVLITVAWKNNFVKRCLGVNYFVQLKKTVFVSRCDSLGCRRKENSRTSDCIIGYWPFAFLLLIICFPEARSGRYVAFFLFIFDECIQGFGKLLFTAAAVGNDQVLN